MGVFTKFEKTKEEHQSDSLRVATKSNETTFEGGLSVFKMIDSDTSQHIIYIPALNLTSYGDTYEKAEEMMKFCIGDLFELLGKMTSKKRDEELNKLGWKRNKLKNKEFSKLLVDPKGVLQNFNISESSIERLTLVTH